MAFLGLATSKDLQAQTRANKQLEMRVADLEGQVLTLEAEMAVRIQAENDHEIRLQSLETGGVPPSNRTLRAVREP